MQVEHDREIKKSEQIEVEESDAYSLFVYAVRCQITRDYYLRRLRIFFNHISLLPRGTTNGNIEVTNTGEFVSVSKDNNLTFEQGQGVITIKDGSETANYIFTDVCI